jgi:hypothetical protein
MFLVILSFAGREISMFPLSPQAKQTVFLTAFTMAIIMAGLVTAIEFGLISPGL